MMRRRGGPGLLSTMARTAVIAGTATAVSNSVNRAAMTREQVRQQQMLEEQAAKQELIDMRTQLAAVQANQTLAAVPAAPAGGADFIAQLQQLAQLKEAGLLTAEEFERAKAKLMAG